MDTGHAQPALSAFSGTRNLRTISTQITRTTILVRLFYSCPTVSCCALRLFDSDVVKASRIYTRREVLDAHVCGRTGAEY